MKTRIYAAPAGKGLKLSFTSGYSSTPLFTHTVGHGDMNEITLPSSQRIRNTNPGGLRASTLPLGHGPGHNTESLRVSGEEAFVLPT